MNKLATIGCVLALVVPSSACSLVGKITGSNKPASASSGSTAPSSGSGSSSSSGGSSGGDSSAAIGAPSPNKTLAQIEAEVVGALEAEAAFSARSTQGGGSLCEPSEADDAPLAVWRVERHKRVSLTCFPIDPDRMSEYAAYGKIGSIQDNGALLEMSDSTTPDASGVQLYRRDANVWAIIAGPSVGIVRVPMPPLEKEKVPGGWLLDYETRADRSKIEVDVLAPSAAAAAKVDLAAEKTRLIAAFEASIAAHNKTKLAEYEAKLDATTFPKAGLKDKAVLAAAREWLEGKSAPSAIDPAKIKKLVVSESSWRIRKDEFSRIKGKIIEVTVGFVRADGSCAFMGFNMQRDYAGAGTYADGVYANGFKSDYVDIRCERLK